MLTQKIAGVSLDDLSFLMARKVLTATLPRHVGSVYFYDVKQGWAVDVAGDDPAVVTPRTSFDLEDSLLDQDCETILIRRDSSITKGIAEKICGKSGMQKTVFFEVQDEQG
ncbi:MAG: hypothetical protein ACXW30_07000 [Micavibrio sp.]